MTRYIPHKPTLKQAAFLLVPKREAFYGGSAGGGKSDALLMGALQWVDQPGYAALLLRRTYADLALPEALMDRADSWLRSTDARWHDTEKTWAFPSGATVTFGYLASEKDKYRYQSAEFQYIAFDELTQFTETQYTYLFSRLRRKAGVNVPLRMRSASNPGGAGHQWVYDRFVVDAGKSGRVFIPAGLDDNPHIDRAAYLESLAELDDITRAQLLQGLWITDPEAHPFRREWWAGQNRYDVTDVGVAYRSVGRWLSLDTAFSDKTSADSTAGVVWELWPDYRLGVRDVWTARLQFPDLLNRIEQEAQRWDYDGKLQGVLIEDKGSGTSALQTLRAAAPEWLARLLSGFNPGQTSKEERARQVSIWCQRGRVLLPHPSAAARWLFDLERQLFEFPDVSHDDIVDAFDQGLLYLEHFLREGWRARIRSMTNADGQ